MDKKDVFTDFIPEGQEEGNPFGEGGYRDFVPAPEPKPQIIEEELPAQEQNTSTPKKTKEGKK